MEDSGMVSIIMLSKNKAQYVEESVRSVMVQTYKNWELLFWDDNSKDDTISKMMILKDETKIRKKTILLLTASKYRRQYQIVARL